MSLQYSGLSLKQTDQDLRTLLISSGLKRCIWSNLMEDMRACAANLIASDGPDGELHEALIPYGEWEKTHFSKSNFGRYCAEKESDSICIISLLEQAMQVTIAAVRAKTARTTFRCTNSFDTRRRVKKNLARRNSASKAGSLPRPENGYIAAMWDFNVSSNEGEYTMVMRTDVGVHLHILTCEDLFWTVETALKIEWVTEEVKTLILRYGDDEWILNSHSDSSTTQWQAYLENVSRDLMVHNMLVIV